MRYYSGLPRQVARSQQKSNVGQAFEEKERSPQHDQATAKDDTERNWDNAENGGWREQTGAKNGHRNGSVHLRGQTESAMGQPKRPELDASQRAPGNRVKALVNQCAGCDHEQRAPPPARLVGDRLQCAALAAGLE